MARRMRFGTWCKKDVEDETPINYVFKAKEWEWNGGRMVRETQVMHFTSEDTVTYAILSRIRNAWVESIERVDGRWNVVLYED